MANNSAPTYDTVSPTTWKFGNIQTTAKGLRKVEIFQEDGISKPIFQLWKPSDPYLRVPYGISEPYNSSGQPDQSALGKSPMSSSVPQSSIKTMPIELKQSHLDFAQAVDGAILKLITTHQAKILDMAPDDELLPLAMLRRQYCGFVKLSKKPEYAPTARVKVNVGTSELATRWARKEGRGTIVSCPSTSVCRGCTVIPILEISGLWLSSTGGFGVTVQATSVLIMSSGPPPVPLFSGLEYAMDVDE